MHGFGSSNSDKALKVSVDDVNNGEYALKVTTVKANNTTAEQAHTAAVLLSQPEAAVLRELGEKLLSHIRSRI
ncbi:hypothetical protein MtrunA17_Chr7g0242111 [Medicago truncatula]|uniref:Uncharacterized protein n=1 Tax=Medicago truncatula TaxID=3880 RepID=A0A396GZJ7_MEDTR|nr:hypothetical protein MtrunA17_Chr7g0242111 [Medicago truncatula]